MKISHSGYLLYQILSKVNRRLRKKGKSYFMPLKNGVPIQILWNCSTVFHEGFLCQILLNFFKEKMVLQVELYLRPDFTFDC
jgi:hypothetical protein